VTRATRMICGLVFLVTAACNSSQPESAPSPISRNQPSDGPATITGTAAPGVVVMIEPLDTPSPPMPDGPAVMDQYGKQFVPDTLLVRVGQVVEFKNSEDVDHNVQVLRMPTGTTVMNESGSKGQVFRHIFEQPGSYEVNCDIHPGMRATIIAAHTPYAALANQDGSFTINNVPPGKYVLKSTIQGRDVAQEFIAAAPRTTVSVR
jgi:plastocyanin